MNQNPEGLAQDPDQELKEAVLSQASALAEEAARLHAQGCLLEASQLVERLVSAAAAFDRSGVPDLARAIHGGCMERLPQDGAVRTLGTHLEGSAPPVPCKVCGGKTAFFGCADLGKSCAPADSQVMPRACVYAAYHQCGSCGFLFTPDLDGWSFQDFQSRIYNDDYIKVDGDFVEVRPRRMAEVIASRLDPGGSALDILDYGGGSGTLESMLRARGFSSVATYDPFFHARGDLPRQSYDLILSFEVFEHVPEPHRLMEDLVSFLRRDGVIFFTTLLQPDNLEELGVSWWYLAPRNGHISLHSRESLQLLALGHGLRLVSLNESTHCAYFMDNPVLHQLLTAG